MKILDANYEQADLQSVVQDNCLHISIPEQTRLLEVCQDYEDLVDETLGDLKTKHLFFEVKEGAKACHGRAFPVLKKNKNTLIKELK